MSLRHMSRPPTRQKLPRPRIELRPPHEHLAADPIAGQWMGGVDQMIAEAAHRDTAVLCQRAERFKKGSTGVLTMIFSAITPRTPRTFIGLARSHSWSSHELHGPWQAVNGTTDLSLSRRV